MRARRGAASGLLLVAALLAGCGDDTTPAQAVPALEGQLAKVDAAVVAEDPEAIRSTANGLALLTREAGDAGTLSKGEVDRILASVAVLVEAVEEPEPAPAPDPEPSEPTEPEAEREDEPEDEPDEGGGIDPVDPFEPGKPDKPGKSKDKGEKKGKKDKD